MTNHDWHNYIYSFGCELNRQIAKRSTRSCRHWLGILFTLFWARCVKNFWSYFYSQVTVNRACDLPGVASSLHVISPEQSALSIRWRLTHLTNTKKLTFNIPLSVNDNAMSEANGQKRVLGSVKLTSEKTLFSCRVQSPSVLMWTLRKSSPGADVMENGCLFKRKVKCFRWYKFFVAIGQTICASSCLLQLVCIPTIQKEKPHGSWQTYTARSCI